MLVQTGKDRRDALRGRLEPVLPDEWQEVPEVLGAVKRSVDDNSSPGRFILTGSVRSDLESAMWPGTGRIIRLNMHGMTQREVLGGSMAASASLLAELINGRHDDFALPAHRPDLRGYLELAVRGGFPGAVLNTPSEHAMTWVNGYLEQLLTRDAAQLGMDRGPRKLDRYFEAVAASSAGIPEHSTLYNAVGIDRKTAQTYDGILQSLFVTEQVQAWTSTHIGRLTKSPKRYVVDPSLMAACLDADVDKLMSDSDLMGRIIDTFVMAQLRPELTLLQRSRTYHVRTKNGREEIDILVELGGGKLLAIELKSSAAPKPSDAKHLRWLRDERPDKFVAGIVFHTGPDAIQFDSDIYALPICALWG